MSKKFIALAVIVMLLAVGFLAGCKSEEEPPDINIEGIGSYLTKFDDVSFDNMPINASIVQGSDKVAAFMHIMEVATTNWERADYVAKISSGGGEAYTAGMGGKMKVRSRYIRNNDTFYYEIAGRIYEANPPAALDAAQGMLNQGRREYSPDMETFYQQEPGNKGDPMMKEEFPFYSCDYSKGDLETFNKEQWKEEKQVKEKIGEFTSFVFNGDTVKDIEIDYDDDEEYYTLKFALNLEDEEAREIATEFPRASLRKIADPKDEIPEDKKIQYKKYEYTMQIYDNGLIRTISTEESWEGLLKVWIFELEGSSQSKNTDYYSWDPEDCSLEDIDFDWID
jgi:hypothetical protein